MTDDRDSDESFERQRALGRVHGAELLRRGWSPEEAVQAIVRRLARKGARPIGIDSDGKPRWPIEALSAEAGELAQTVRLSIHAALRCPCGRGSEVPEMSERGAKVPLAISRVPLFARGADEYSATEAIAAARGAPEVLRCARCGGTGKTSHMVFARDGGARYALPRAYWA